MPAKRALPRPRDSDHVRIHDVKLLSDNWYVLRTIAYDLKRRDGTWQRQQREAYDRGHGATVLLYDPARRTVVLARQFRFPAYTTGHDGYLIETAAGLLDDAHPDARVAAEAEEETGYRVRNLREVMRAFMSPGAVTECIHLFVAEYSADDRVSSGGGLADEGEDIEVLELDFDQAYAMISTAEICDGKTIMLLQYAALHLFGTPPPKPKLDGPKAKSAATKRKTSAATLKSTGRSAT
jgi:nudix-type nucleoside diphosphatase (YffH/AdpP family)